MSTHPFINIAVKAARTAGNIIMRGYQRLDLVKVNVKGPNNYVTNIDKAAEEAIIYTILTAYPNHSILSEERGAIKNDEEYQWIIDPLDGTTNFIHGFPHFCISIAFKNQGKLEQAVIYDPVRNDLFTASRGGGAQKNNHRIRVSPKFRLEDCLLSTGLASKARHDFDAYHESLKTISRKCTHIRQSGSAALDLAYVASDHLEGTWYLGLSPWDIAAGALLIKEAGGLVVDFDGQEEYLKKGHIVAGNPKIAKTLLQELKPFFNTTHTGEIK